MVATIGLIGLRPAPEHATRLASPPYDVIKPGTPLEARLKAEPASLYHVILGDSPADALARLERDGFLLADEEPSYYVYEQRWGEESRTGVFVAAEVSEYAAHQIIRHEKTFDEKVKGRLSLRRETGHSFGPVFVITEAPIAELLEEAKLREPLYAMTTDLGGISDLHGIEGRVFRVPEASDLGRRLQAALLPDPFYIADGHHRYHASLKNGQGHFLCYVTSEARILAYDRVVRGVRPFSEVREQLDLVEVDEFRTPAIRSFCLYTREGCWELAAKRVPEDVVGGLDCAILERELYPLLGLDHSMVVDPKHFDYYAESQLDEMKAAVDRGDYDLAIALHPVSIDALMAVANAGLEDAEIVMPEKSTFFAPKILSGLFIYRHTID